MYTSKNYQMTEENQNVIVVCQETEPMTFE